MANLKLTLNDFDSNDFNLIAIHTSLKDFRLAFLLNSVLEIMLFKNDQNIFVEMSNGIASFAHFSFEDIKHDLNWSLISNKAHFMANNLKNGMFEEETISVNLIPEFKKADFLLKIDNVDVSFKSQEIINKISTITEVSTVYTIENNQLKSINNLIF